MKEARGFSLLEVILMLMMFSVLAATATLTMRDNMTATRAKAFAETLRSDIAYAQSLSMSRNLRYRVYFNTIPAPTPNGYAIVNDANNNLTWGELGEFAEQPVGGGGFSVPLDSGSLTGISISAVGFSGPYVEFDGLGVPSSNGAPLPAPQSVSVSGGGAVVTVTVEPETGHVRSP